MQDLDSYKAYAKEDILNWLALLRKCGITNDWMIIVVEGSGTQSPENDILLVSFPTFYRRPEIQQTFAPNLGLGQAENGHRNQANR